MSTARQPLGYFSLLVVNTFGSHGYRAHMEGVYPLIVAAGGKYLCRGGETRVNEGDFKPHRIVLFEWPSLEAHEAFLNSDAYAALKAIRLESAETIMFAIAGLD